MFIALTVFVPSELLPTYEGVHRLVFGMLPIYGVHPNIEEGLVPQVPHRRWWRWRNHNLGLSDKLKIPQNSIFVFFMVISTKKLGSN